jgi:hypothetical protein
MSTVFLSYAREDLDAAERLYMDLRRAEIDAWMDKKNLLPGQNWEHEIRKAIRGARYFLALVSKVSVGKRGFVQREMRLAMDVLDEVPIDQIFLIPVRLDDSEPPDFKIKAINRVDLFPSYRKGLERLLSTLADLEKHPLVALDPTLAISRRAPIEYTPFRTFEAFLRSVFERLPDHAHFHDREFSYFVTFRTMTDGVNLPERVRKANPEETTIVLRSGYTDLSVTESAIEVSVMFDSRVERIRIPFSSVEKVRVPEIGLLIARLPRDK